MSLLNSKSKLKFILIFLVYFFSFNVAAQNHQEEETHCHIIDNSTDKYGGTILRSTIEQINVNNFSELSARNSYVINSETEVSSFVKAYGFDVWLVNKTTNNSITIETYPETVGSGNQSVTLGTPVMHIIKPDGTYLVENYANHTPSNPTGNFYVIPANSPNGTYKIEIGVYLNDSGGYRLKCLSDGSYLSLSADTSISDYSESHIFKETTGTDWTDTKSESFSIGDEVHEWTLPLLEGENLIIDLYNVAPFVMDSEGEQWDTMDTKLYLLDSNDNLVASNDDGGNSKNARIYYTVPSDGNYKVIATNYGRFDDFWSVDQNLQDNDWNLGSTGLTYYDLKIESSSTLSFTFDEFALNNPAAIKINAILITDDETLTNLPVSTSHVQTLISNLNTAYYELYDVANWPGFELAGITKYYDPDYATTSAPHNVLAEVGSGPAAKQNYLNLIFTEIDGNLTGIIGTTYLYNNVTAANGASIVLDDVSGNSGVLIHEVGHIIGINHIAGTWPPAKYTLSLQSNSMGYLTNYISRAENSYMSNWTSSPVYYSPDLSIYLTAQPASLNTPSYGDLFSEGFRSWLITNEYIDSNAANTSYEGNDTSTNASNNWTNIQTITSADNSVFSNIASSKNPSNNHAAYVTLNTGNSKLSYGFRQTDNTWSHNSYTANSGRSNVDMNSDGDAIIIFEPWYSTTLTAIYKDHGQDEWSSPETIAVAEIHAMRSNFKINNNGDVAVVWLESDNNGKRYIKFNERINGSWVGETIISDSDFDKELPSIAYNDNRDVAISWQNWNMNNEGRYDVVGAFRNGTSQLWGALETYSDTNNHAGFSQVAINSSGDAIFYWRQATGNFVANEAENTVGVLKTRYRNYDGSLEQIVNVSPNGEDSFNASKELTEPRIVFEGDHAAVTWWGINGNHNVIYAATMVDKTTWNSTALTTNGKSADLPSISMDSNGFIAVAWQRTDGTYQRVQSKFYNPTTSSWSSVMTLSSSDANAIHSDITVDGNSNATASWVLWNNSLGKYMPQIKQYSPVVITLLGDNPVTLEVGSIYNEPSATAVNENNEDVSDNIVISGIVDNSIVGTYTLTYDATDSENNVALSVIRTVNVVDTTAPIITLLGDLTVTIQEGSTYTDAGATAEDNYDGVLTSSIVSNNSVDASTVGSYLVTYNVTDANGNTATQVTRTVIVEQICVSSESFETFPPNDWIIVNSDVGINDIVQSDYWSDDGSYSLRFSSYYGTPTQNQYLISPQLVTTETDRYMKFYPYASTSQQSYRVGWSSTGTDIDNDFTWGEVQTAYDYTPLFEKTDLPVGTKYIIVEHIFDTWGGKMYIDSFCLPSLFTESNTVTWSGATNNDWDTSTNWSDGVTPTLLDDVIIPDDLTNYPTSSAPVSVNSVTMASGSSLIAQSSFSGNITYNRSLENTNWYLISSPVVGQDIDTFVSTEGLASGLDNNIGLSDYNNSTPGWTYYQNGQTSTGNFNLGDGRAIMLTAAEDISFTGTIDVNDSGVDIALTSNVNGLNLIGNPYPSYIPVNINANSTNNILDINSTSLQQSTIWLWNQSTGTYDIVNHTSSIKYIAPGQGFFVSSNGNNSFYFFESMQSHQATDSFQREVPSTRPEINLTMTNGTATRDTDIFYIRGTTSGWDNGYDSSIFAGTSNEFMIYTHLVSGSEGESLGIQSLPDTNYENMVIPVGVNAVSGTEITISATEVNFPAGMNLYLEDKEEESFTMLDTNSTYTTTLTNDENGIGRFYLYTNTSSLSTVPLSINQHQSIYISSRKNLRLVGVQNGTATIQMYTILGKEMLSTTFEGQGVNDINLPILSSGVYIVQLITKKGMTHKKINVE